MKKALGDVYESVDAVAILAIVGSAMYFCYPNTAFGDNYMPWCYQVLQTFIYHGLVFA